MMALIGELGVQGFTKMFDSHGRGGRGPKENTPVWPGTNHHLLIAAPEVELRRIASAVRRLQGTFRLRPGITLILQDAEML
jgi:hypothetical protein